MRSACDRSTACFASLNGASGFCRMAPHRRRRLHFAHRRRDRAARRGVGAERADLKRHEVRRRTGRLDVGVQLALEHRAHVDVPVALLS